MAASLEGEPGSTPAGKSLPHSYHQTRFQSVVDQYFLHLTKHIFVPSSLGGMIHVKDY